MNKTVLHWSYRDFKHVPIDLIYYDEQLEEIYLKENFITKIPDWLLQLTNLKFIHLAGNSIDQIPKNIYLLENLEFLDISNNCLDLLPNTIGNMKNLKHFNVSGNKLHVIPNSIGQLKLLEFLDISENLISTLPIELCECNRLVELLLNGLPNLLHIPERIANMKTVQTFCADRCGLLYLPANISKFLSHVRMFNNTNIAHIPMAYEKHFATFYQSVQKTERTSIDPQLFLVREKDTNTVLLLPIGTRKILPVPSTENGITLYDHALNNLNTKTLLIQFYKCNKLIDSLPTQSMKNHLKIGPISQCNYCYKSLYTTYYFAVVKRRSSTSKTIFSCNFCSMVCANGWFEENKTKYYKIDWELCDN